MVNRYFGTDGIRGLFGGDVIHPSFVLKLGQAAGRVLKKIYSGKITVLIGKDTRISGYLLESCLEAGLTSSGIDVLMLGPIPTPAVAYLTRTFKAQAGIVISASHNPYYDNGIKFFSIDGNKLSDEVELEIEKLLDEDFKIVPALELGKVRRVNDACGRYIEFCKGTLGLNYSLKGFKIVVDCANGATYRIAPSIFEELGAEVISIGVSPNGFNINQACGSTDIRSLASRVLNEGADLGIAFDGDGDRIIMVDHLGCKVTGDQILYILAKFYYRINALQGGGVVGTIASSLGLEVSLKQLGIDFLRANVGDRYVREVLFKHKWALGGENSGHILHLGLTTTGDGIVAALQVLRAMKEEEKNLSELTKVIIKYPILYRNIKTKNAQFIIDNPQFKKALSEVEYLLQKSSGRVLVRCSGTESVLRLQLEGNDENLDGMMQSLVDVVGSLNLDED